MTGQQFLVSFFIFCKWDSNQQYRIIKINIWNPKYGPRDRHAPKFCKSNVRIKSDLDFINSLYPLSLTSNNAIVYRFLDFFTTKSLDKNEKYLSLWEKNNFTRYDLKKCYTHFQEMRRHANRPNKHLNSDWGKVGSV